MKYALFNDDGIPLGFFDEDHPIETLPDGCVEITDKQHQAIISSGGTRKWKNGKVVKFDPFKNDPTKNKQWSTNHEARKYLRETDWYVVRMQETGEPIPNDISTARANARNSVEED